MNLIESHFICANYPETNIDFFAIIEYNFLNMLGKQDFNLANIAKHSFQQCL